MSDELAGHLEGHPLAVMLPICRDLLGDAVREAGCVFALGDSDGALLWIEGAAQTRGQSVRTWSWSCAALPIRDPDNGRMIGVLDVTGGEAAAQPQLLALVRATVRAIESEFGRQVAVRDLRAHQTYDSGARPHQDSSGARPHQDSSGARPHQDSSGARPHQGVAALVSPGGRILAASADLGLTRLPGLTPLSGLTPTGHGSAQLPDGRRLLIEPVGVGGYLVVRFVDGDDEPDPVLPLRLSVLGRDTTVLDIDGRGVKLGPRHSEILVLLTFAGQDGLTAGQLASGLSPDGLNPTTLRVDINRLRTLIGEDVLASRPYLLRRPVRTDAQVVDDLLQQGRVREAVRRYAGPLLPRSQAPGIVGHRAALAERLGAAVAASYDARLIQRWLDSPWGAEDAVAWRALAALLPEGSSRRAQAALRAQSLPAR